MVNSINDRVRWREILTPTLAPSLGVVCMGVWLHAADGLLVSTMMPAIVSDIGGVNLIPWTVALYEIGSIVAGAASGLVALRHGIRVPMAAAAGLFSLGCAVSALAPEMWVMLFGRLLQGLGGGGLVAMSFVSAGLLFPKRLIARVMAAISTIWAMSAFLGPLIGGLFVEWATWRAGFWFFAVQAVLLAGWMATRPEPSQGAAGETGRRRFPVLRLLWLSAGVVSIAYAGIDVAPIRTTAFVALGLACLVVFLRLEARKTEDRLLPANPISFTNPVGAALTMVLCFAAATIAIGVYVPFLLTSLHGTSALVAGYIIALEAIAWTAFALLFSGSPERHDSKMIVIGVLFVTASIPLFAYAVPAGPLWLVAFSAALQGCGFGMAWTFILRRATAIAPPGETQRVSGAIPTIQRLGYALGAAYIGIVANATGIGGAAGRTSMEFAASAVFLSCLPLAGLGLLAAVRFVRFIPSADEVKRPAVPGS